MGEYDKVKNNIILFRKINVLTLGLCLYYSRRRNPYIIFYISESSVILSVLRFLSPTISLKKINPIGHYQHNSYGEAIDAIDKVFERILQNRFFLKKALGHLKTKNYHLILKKELLYEFAGSLYVYEIIKESSIQNYHSLIVDYRYFQYYSFIEGSPLPNKFFPSYLIRLPEVINYNFLIINAKLKLLFSFFFFAGLTLFPIFKKKKLKEYKIAILINNLKYQFKANGKYFAFLIDHKKVLPEDIIFIEKVNVPQFYKNKFKNYNFTGNISYKNINKYGSKKVLIKQLLNNFRIVVFGLFSQNKLFLTKSLTTIFFNNLRWESLISHYKFKHFITFNDEDTSHIARNIIFNKHNIETWYYAHSAAMGYVSEILNGNDDKRHILWTFLYYDNYVTWNDAMKNFILKHKVHFTKIHVVGCLWSQLIDKPSVLNKQKEIVVFDTSYIGNISEGVAFYSDIVEYGIKNRNVKIVFKPKKDISDYKPGKFFYGTDEYVKLQSIFKSINESPNMEVAEFDSDSYTLISNSCLVITHAISSPTIEAISAQIPSLFYDPADNYNNTIYSKVPNLILNNKKDLWAQIDKLLTKKDIQYNQLQEIKYKGIIEDYYDCKAIDRFRELLIAKT